VQILFAFIEIYPEIVVYPEYKLTKHIFSSVFLTLVMGMQTINPEPMNRVTLIQIESPQIVGPS
jgi:hypothetical protein